MHCLNPCRCGKRLQLYQKNSQRELADGAIPMYIYIIELLRRSGKRDKYFLVNFTKG